MKACNFSMKIIECTQNLVNVADRDNNGAGLRGPEGDGSALV
jgi:hypothetical protein